MQGESGVGEYERVSKHGTIRYVRYGLLLVCYSNCVNKTRRFFRNPGQRSLKVIGTDSNRSTTYRTSY